MAWQALVDIVAEARQLDRENATRTPVECPNDYTTLTEGPAGVLFCPWDGWTYPQGV
jgi:hypothetical protein